MSATVAALRAAIIEQAVCLAPSTLAERLERLAVFADMAQLRPDITTPDGALRLIRDDLRAIAAGVRE